MVWIKYIAWSVAFTTTFTGTWLFDFTTSDPNTHRKILTRFGKIALVLALISAALAAGLTMDADISAAREKSKIEKLHLDTQKFQQQSIDFQRDMKSAQAKANSEREKMVELLAVLDKNRSAISEDAQASVAALLESEPELKRTFPDLYEAFQKAETVDEIWGVAELADARRMHEAFEYDGSGCTFPPFNNNDEVSISAAVNTGYLNFQVIRTHSAAWFRVFDINYLNAPSKDYSWAKGFYVEFDNGNVRFAQCLNESSSGCTADLSGINDHAKLYDLLRSQLIKSIYIEKSDGRKVTFQMPGSKAEELKSLWVCVKR